MAWVAPVSRATGYVITASNWNDVGYSNMRYLKGLDGTITLEDGLDLGTNELTVNSIEVITAAGALVAHGASVHTNITRKLFIPAVSMHLGTNATGTSRGDGGVVQFPDAVIATVFGYFYVPDDFVSYTSLSLVWECASGAPPLYMYWDIDVQWAASGDVYGIGSEAGAKGQTVTGGANVINVQEPNDAVAFAGLGASDYVGYEIQRDATHVDDTLGGTVYVFGLLFEYVANQ